MKKIIALALSVIMATTTFSQQTKHYRHTKEEYLRKSKNQKTATHVFLLGGGTLILAAIIIPKGKQMTETYGSIWSIPVYGTYYKNETLKGTLGGIGILSLLPALPLSLASHKNKRRSMKVSFHKEPVPRTEQGSMTSHFVSTVRLKISL